VRTNVRGVVESVHVAPYVRLEMNVLDELDRVRQRCEEILQRCGVDNTTSVTSGPAETQTWYVWHKGHAPLTRPNNSGCITSHGNRSGMSVKWKVEKHLQKCRKEARTLILTSITVITDK
jgi:hypothetical protein